MKKSRPDGLFRRPGSLVWYCWVNGIRRSTGYTDVAAARIRKAEIQRIASDPQRFGAEVADLQGAVEDFLEHLTKVEDKPASTLHFYTGKCKALLRYFGQGRSLASLRDAKVWTAFISDRLAQRTSRNTVGHELTTARRVLRIAKLNGAFPFDLDEVFPPRYSREYRPKTRALAGEEIGKLLEALDATTPRLAGFVAWNLAAASRLSEVEHAEAVDLLQDGALVRVRGTKTAKAAAVVPIAPGFRWLLHYAVERGAATGPMFGRWHNPSRDLAAACTRAGIPPCTTNDLRRTHASMLRDADVATRAIAAVLRNSPRMIELVYAPTTGGAAAPLVERAVIDIARPTAKDSSPHYVEPKNLSLCQCPGSESNRRHEDFQSDLSGRCSQLGLGSEWAGAAGEGSAAAKDSPHTNVVDLDWARGQLAAAAAPLANVFGPWSLKGAAA